MRRARPPPGRPAARGSTASPSDAEVGEGLEQRSRARGARRGRRCGSAAARSRSRRRPRRGPGRALPIFSASLKYRDAHAADRGQAARVVRRRARVRVGQLRPALGDRAAQAALGEREADRRGRAGTSARTSRIQTPARRRTCGPGARRGGHEADGQAGGGQHEHHRDERRRPARGRVVVRRSSVTLSLRQRVLRERPGRDEHRAERARGQHGDAAQAQRHDREPEARSRRTSGEQRAARVGQQDRDEQDAAAPGRRAR